MKIKLLSASIFFILSIAQAVVEIEEEQEAHDLQDDIIWNGGEISIQTDQIEDTSESEKRSALQVHITPFFTVERTIENSEIEDGEIDVFEWGSKQRMVFTLTNPTDTQQITVNEFNVNILDSLGKKIPPIQLIRYADDPLMIKSHTTRSVAYELVVKGAELEEDEVYTFEVSLNYKETSIQEEQQKVIEKAFSQDTDQVAGDSD